MANNLCQYLAGEVFLSNITFILSFSASHLPNSSLDVEKTLHTCSSVYLKTYSLSLLLPFDLAHSYTPFTSQLRYYFL